MSGFTDQDGFPADYEFDERPRRRRTGCACFAPGEVSGTCPGQDRCPMAQEEDPEETTS